MRIKTGDRMIIGTASHQFDVNHHFAKLPAGVKPGYTHGVCVDIDNNVYVFNQSERAVMIFDRQGNFLRSWGSEFQYGAHGMRLTDEQHHQFLYLSDYEKHEVVKTTLGGEVQFRVGMPPRKDIYTSPSEFKPTDIAVAPTGDVYIFDGYGKPYIHVYDRHFKYLQSIGGPGAGEGQLKCPHGGWIDTRKPTPELYVADRGNHRVQVFSLDGKFQRIITDPEILQPCGFYQYKDELYVPDLQAKLLVLDKHDKVCAVLGENPAAPKTEGWPNIQSKLVDGKFNSPHQCCVDTFGDVYVVEWISDGRITKLTRTSA
jgi:hypothetical protein